jgi:putative transposase
MLVAIWIRRSSRRDTSAWHGRARVSRSHQPPPATRSYSASGSSRPIPGRVPDKVTTDGHGSYPRAIRSTLGKRVAHRTNVYRNNGLEQDHRGIKGRIRGMRGLKSFTSADRFCRAYDELRNHLRPRSRHNQDLPASRSRVLYLRRAITALAFLTAG